MAEIEPHETQTLSAEDEARLGHQNLITYSRDSTRWCRRGSFEERDGILSYAGGSWLPVNCNGAFRTDDSVPAPKLIAVADDFFARRKRGYSIRTRDSGQDGDIEAACLTSGLEAFGNPVPEMACRHPFTDVETPDGIEFRTVSTAAEVADFVEVNANAYSTYGMPPEVLTDSFDEPAGVLGDPNAVLLVAYRGEEPLAAALTFLSDGIASLQWVGTVASSRQLGLGRIITQLTTNVAFERGAACCTLQASEMGEPIYRKLGYETIYHYNSFCRWSAPTA